MSIEHFDIFLRIKNKDCANFSLTYYLYAKVYDFNQTLDKLHTFQRHSKEESELFSLMREENNAKRKYTEDKWVLYGSGVQEQICFKALFT